MIYKNIFYFFKQFDKISKNNINFKLMRNKAFTLIELIVVITILAILGTIAFISFKGYTWQARDSARIADLNSIKLGLSLLQSKWDSLPTPDNVSNVTNNGNIVTYEGIIWENIKRRLNISGNLVDPTTQKSYTYAITKDKSKNILMWFIEWESAFITKVSADNWNNNTPYIIWEEVWFILDENKDPSWGEITAIPNNNYTAFFWQTELTVSGNKVQGFPLTGESKDSCKAFLDAWYTTDWLYKINMDWWAKYAYCNQTEWGWMYFWQYTNEDTTSPEIYFWGFGNPTNNIVDFSDAKKSWSFSIDKLKIKGNFEIWTNIWTATITQWYSPVSSQWSDYTNWIMKTNRVDLFTSDDLTIQQRYWDNIWIKHRCDISWPDERTLNFINEWRDKTITPGIMKDNSQMQFWVSQNHHWDEDYWHWNIENHFYYRPVYNYCDNTTEHNPWNEVTVYFWIKY